MFYFTCNHVSNWNKVISATEGVLGFWNYFGDIEHVGKYSRAAIIVRNNFKITSTSGTFTCAEIKLFQTDVKESWNSSEIIYFTCNHDITAVRVFRVSVCLSVTDRYCVKMNERSIMTSSQLGSTMYLVFGDIRLIKIFSMNHPKHTLWKSLTSRHRNMGVTYSRKPGSFTAR